MNIDIMEQNDVFFESKWTWHEIKGNEGFGIGCHIITKRDHLCEKRHRLCEQGWTFWASSSLQKTNKVCLKFVLLKGWHSISLKRCFIILYWRGLILFTCYIIIFITTCSSVYNERFLNWEQKITFFFSIDFLSIQRKWISRKIKIEKGSSIYIGKKAK